MKVCNAKYSAVAGVVSENISGLERIAHPPEGS